MGVEELKLGKQTPWWHNFGSQSLRCVFSAKTRLCGSWFFGVAHNFIGHSEDSLKCYEHGVPSKHERKNFRKQKTRLAPRSFRTLCLWWGVERRIFWMNTLWSVNWKMSLAFTQPLWLGRNSLRQIFTVPWAMASHGNDFARSTPMLQGRCTSTSWRDCHGQKSVWSLRNKQTDQGWYDVNRCDWTNAVLNGQFERNSKHFKEFVNLAFFCTNPMVVICVLLASVPCYWVLLAAVSYIESDLCLHLF